MNENKAYRGPYITVQNVTNRHRKKCESCGKKPEKIRILVWSGDINSMKMDCYCVNHGISFLKEKITFLNDILEEFKELGKPPKIEKDTFCNFINFKE